MIKVIITLIITGLVYWGMIFVIGHFRMKKGVKKQVKSHKANLENIRSQIKSGHPLDEGIYDNYEEVDPKKAAQILKRLDKTDKKSENILDNVVRKIQYVDPDFSKNKVIMSWLALSLMVTVFGIMALGVDKILFIAFPALLLGFFLLNTIANHKYEKKISRFLDNFIYALDIIARGVKSGLMLNDCFNLISKEVDPAVGEQFQMVLHDLRVGLPMERVMMRFTERLPIKEVRFFAIVIIVQAKTGGNLAEVVGNLSTILRQRKAIILRIRTLSQEAKSSAAILMCLPFVIVGLISIVGGDYMDPLFYTSTGHIIIAGSMMWMSIGIFIMRKMINFYR
ncbi:MAG: type II secretion system F family protein [Pseudomonadota bacterium]